ncbi:MAG: hypothetical protein JOZ87_04110 [Chloroflexi bacterium]|nr:hypothetical protein [Chloroflexota bacterium]
MFIWTAATPFALPEAVAHGELRPIRDAIDPSGQVFDLLPLFVYWRLGARPNGLDNGSGVSGDVHAPF